MKRDDYESVSETGNWNVASDYSQLKIMKPLLLCDEYEIIATFGAGTLIEDLQQNFNTDLIKIKAFKRLIKQLLLLIDNSIFAVKNQGLKEDLQKLKDELKKINKIVPALSKIRKNQKTKVKELIIYEEKYDKVLERVVEIKAEINEPLNKSHLIFTDKEEFDPKEQKKKIFDDITNRG